MASRPTAMSASRMSGRRTSAPSGAKLKWIFFSTAFLMSLAFAFGIGYRMGEDSAWQSSNRASSGGVSLAPSAAPDRPSPSTPRRPMLGLSDREIGQTVWIPTESRKTTLYFASFKTFADAEKEKARLESRGIVGVEISERRPTGAAGPSWYRLSYGRFSTRQSAVDYGRQLVERGIIKDFWPTELP